MIIFLEKLSRGGGGEEKRLSIVWTEEKRFVIVLVTGGAGFIGSHLVRAWLARGAEVRVLDNFRTGKLSNLEGLPVQLFEGSICDTAVVDAAVRGVEVVHHLAALVSVPESVDKPVETEEINVVGTIRLLEAAKRHGVRRFVFSSSSAVYGDVVRQVHRESDLPAPASPYAISKLAGEYYVGLAHDPKGMRTTSLRYFNVYGPRQDPGSPYAAAVSIFFARAVSGQPLRIFGDGEQTRDFVYVGDVVAANLLAAQQGEGVYNVATGSGVSIRELAELIRQIASSDSGVEFAAPRPGDVRHSRGDAERLRRLGWEPQVTLEKGLAETYRWMRASREDMAHE